MARPESVLQAARVSAGDHAAKCHSCNGQKAGHKSARLKTVRHVSAPRDRVSRAGMNTRRSLLAMWEIGYGDGMNDS